MKRLLLVCTLAFGMGVATETSKAIAPNSCLVVAFEFEAALEAKHLINKYTWTRLVAVTYWWSSMGHAYCIYALRNGDLYSYDVIRGSMKLGTRSQKIKDVVRALKQNDRRIRNGKYLD